MTTDAKTKVANLTESLEFDVAYDKRMLDKFVANFNEDPAYTLSWSKDTFERAARLSVNKAVLHFLEQYAAEGLEPEKAITNLRSWATETATRMGRDHAQSTSAVANVMENCVRVAWFEFVDKLKD